MANTKKEYEIIGTVQNLDSKGRQNTVFESVLEEYLFEFIQYLSKDGTFKVGTNISELENELTSRKNEIKSLL